MPILFSPLPVVWILFSLEDPKALKGESIPALGLTLRYSRTQYSVTEIRRWIQLSVEEAMRVNIWFSPLHPACTKHPLYAFSLLVTVALECRTRLQETSYLSEPWDRHAQSSMNNRKVNDYGSNWERQIKKNNISQSARGRKVTVDWSGLGRLSERGGTGAGAQGLGRARGRLTGWTGVGSRDAKDKKEWRQGHQTEVSWKLVSMTAAGKMDLHLQTNPYPQV